MGVIFSHYGELREVDATDGEIKTFEIITELLPETPLELVRKSDNYVTALYGLWDIARIKYTDRAKWIMLPTVEAKQVKHRINSPDEVREFADLLKKSVETAERYNES